MIRRQHVVVVAQNPVLATTLLSWLSSAGYELAVVTTFAAARTLLETSPALMVSEMKLGQYNGLHLALKAKALGVPAVVIGPDDTVLAREAGLVGAIYLSSVLRRRQLLDLIAEHVGETPVPSRASGSVTSAVSWSHLSDGAGTRNRRLLH